MSMSSLSLESQIPLLPKNLEPSRSGYELPISSFQFGLNHRTKIMEDIDHYDIPIYNFPYDPEEDDEDTIEDNMELRVRVRFREKHELMLLGSPPICCCWL